MASRQGRGLATLVACMAALPAGACAAPAFPGRSGRLAVVAAENFWGSIASELGGNRVVVRSIVAGPNTDPHDYEATARDARAFAAADYVVYNGGGYDPWAAELGAATRRTGRRVLDVARLVGVKAGGNPHRWYSPPDVARVIDRMTSDFERLAPGDAPYFQQQRDRFISEGLARYRSLVSTIRAAYAGTPVGASESIFSPLASALGLDLVTPHSFLDAISEGADPTAADKALIDRQIKGMEIKTYVFNSQNSTPDIRAQVAEARAAGIPVVSITETLSPASAAFQDWQVAELEALQAALARGTGR